MLSLLCFTYALPFQSAHIVPHLFSMFKKKNEKKNEIVRSGGDGVALRATTNPAAWRIACRRLASSIPRPASRRCLDRREISIAPFGFRHAAGHEKRPSPRTKLHEKYDTYCWQTSVDWKQLFETTSFYGGQPPADSRAPCSYTARIKNCFCKLFQLF